MKKLVLASLLTVLAVPALALPALAKTSEAVAAKKGKSEPAPKDDRRGGGEGHDPREGTYEGNERGGGSEGGSYEGGGSGGGGGSFEGELFDSEVTTSSYTKETIEDRGDVLLITSELTSDVAPTETCTVTTKKAIDKVTQKVIKSDIAEVCIDHD